MMAWITKHYIRYIHFLVIIATTSSALGIGCGYPGSPAYGRPVPTRDVYRLNSAVGFSCALGYTLLGNLKRVCLNNGTWSGTTPICDRSLPSMEQHASSRATLEMYDAQKAIDGLRDTCTYTDKKRPRWVRVDLRKPHLVQAVSVTVPRSSYHTDNAHFTIYVISVKDATTASYHKCADFNGKFPTPTIKLPCNGVGIQGSYVHIEDNRKNLDYFSICEIEIFVQKESYECGEPDRPSNSYTTNPEVGIVEYRCMFGYQLIGSKRRNCLPNGQWSESQPLCKEIVCPLLDEVPHGTLHYLGSTRNQPQQGTIGNITCDYGFQPVGDTIECLENGQWSNGTLVCEPVDCKPPTVTQQRYLLMNGTTTYRSMALLYCESDQETSSEGNEEVITCREDGTWKPPVTLHCAVKTDGASHLGLIEEENLIPNGVIIGMAILVFLLLLVLIFILLVRRKQLMRRNSTESLPSKATTSSNESKSVLPYENDAFYASISAEEPKPTTTEAKGETVERGILASILYAKRKLQKSDKRKDHIGADAKNGGNRFYEEVGHRSRRQRPGEVESVIQPVYAQVDLEEKRRSRLAKNLTEQLDCSEIASIDPCYPLEEIRDYESELDTEPIKLRELPPIPDDDQSSGTYASLSRPPEPPPTPTFMRNNELYVTRMMDSRNEDNLPNMKDNDLYSS